MRVYNRGKMVPMKDVTWDILCDSHTVVIREYDPDINFPSEIYKKRAEAIPKALKALGHKG